MFINLKKKIFLINTKKLFIKIIYFIININIIFINIQL